MSLRIAKIIACIRSAAPYLAIELILPGGSLIALTLWLVKNRSLAKRHLARRVRAGTAPQLVAVLRPSTASTLCAGLPSAFKTISNISSTPSRTAMLAIPISGPTWSSEATRP